MAAGVMAEEVDELFRSEFPEMFDFMVELHRERSGSGRSTVLVSAAMLDELLRRLLFTVMVDKPSAEALLGREDTGGDAPLSSFSSRIKAARGLGLISSDVAGKLDKIRGLRNQFAHKVASKISDQSVRQRVENLMPTVSPLVEALGPPDTLSLNQKFEAITYSTAGDILIAIRRARSIRDVLHPEQAARGPAAAVTG